MTTILQLTRRLRSRLPRHQDDRGSMAFALLAVLIGATLGSLMLPMLITQSRSTSFDMASVHSLHAAQTGIDVVLGRIRASTTADSNDLVGDPSQLPCYTADQPFTGTVEGTGNTTYRVYVTYWFSTPTKDPSSTSRPMTCSPGYGPYDATSAKVTPHYAVVHSTGVDPSAAGGSRGRTLESTYTFQTDDTNVSGGVIRLYPAADANQSWCMDAGSADPAPGTQLVLQECSTTTPPKAQQVFSYRKDLSIQLVSSISDTNPKGLCIDTSPTDHYVDDDKVVLNTCDQEDPTTCPDVQQCSPSNQQWSINDSSHLEGAQHNQSSTDNRCIHATSPAPGIALVLHWCEGGTDNPRQTWVPSPTAGAGMAGASNHQLVNFQQFAMCLDVTNQEPSSSFLILYTCKQNPNPDNVTWNQKFTPVPAVTDRPTRTLLQTTRWGQPFCLTSPGTNGGYAVLTPTCPGGPSDADASSWTVNQALDAHGQELPYAQKFTIVDSGGHCLGVGKNSDMAGQYSKATVSICNGSRGQKWNAVSTLDSAAMSNTHEIVPAAP